MALNYARMPGFGDLPGDSRHPNSPDYVEPAFGLDDAAENVAGELYANDEAGRLVDEVADAAGLLRWISHNAEVPPEFRMEFRFLIEQAERLERMRDAEYGALNGETA